MKMDYYQKISAPLTIMEEELRNVLCSETAHMQAINSYVLSSPGKRIRPALFFLTLGLWDQNPAQHLPVALAIELVHTATLLHDDVVDAAAKRRGKASVNTVWGNQTAVLVGDYLFAKAFSLLTEYGSMPLVSEMAALVEAMAEGEIQQQAQRFNPGISREDYLGRITKKTAKFFTVAACAGAMVSKADAKSVNALKNYGYHIGMAFQIIDDLLDFCSNSEQIGKSVANDLQQGIITLPVLHVLTVSKNQKRLAECIVNQCIDESLIDDINHEMVACKSADYVRSLAKEYVIAAISQLSVLPDRSCRETLAEVARFIVEREC